MSKSFLTIVPRGYLPELAGGLEIFARETTEFLITNGYTGSVAAKAPDQIVKGFLHKALRKIRGPYLWRNNILNHQVLLDVWHPIDLNTFIDKQAPSFLICHVCMCDDLVERIIELKRPTLFYLHSNEIPQSFKNIPESTPFMFVCGSEFIKQQFLQVCDKPIQVMRPLLEHKAISRSQGGEKILVINPHPKKGGLLVADIAKALPERQFLVIGGWEHTRSEPLRIIEQRLSALPNVERLGHLDDMYTAFQQAKCLLMPCIVEEAFGRAAAESLSASVPVVASDRGALPETVGSGGIILDAQAPLSDWTAAIDSLYDDDALYASLKNNAIVMSEMNDRQQSVIQQQLLDYAERLISNR